MRSFALLPLGLAKRLRRLGDRLRRGAERATAAFGRRFEDGLRRGDGRAPMIFGPFGRRFGDGRRRGR